jgi:hypothetical protein
VSIQFSRREALIGLLAGLVVPAAAQARVVAARPEVTTLDVADVLTFDPRVPREPVEFTTYNLVFRTLPAATNRTAAEIDDLRGQPLAQLAVQANGPGGSQTLTLNNAYIVARECAYLSQQNRGQQYDEFGLTVESTHGSWRRNPDVSESTRADYWVTPDGKVRWERRLA